MAADGEAEQFGGQDLAGGGLGAETGGFDNRVPEEIAVFLGRLSGGYTDTHFEGEFSAAVMAFKRLLDLHCAGEVPGWRSRTRP